MFIKFFLESYKKYLIDLNNLNKLLNSKNNQQDEFLNGFRIYLTENCNANCSHCFNSKIREVRNMDKEKLISVFQYLKENKVKILKIMGGEPTIHPEFSEIYGISQQYFQHVNLFTNALNDNVLFIKPRDCDGIIYNFIFVTSKFNFYKLLPDFSNFARVFEIVIGSNTDTAFLCQQIDYVHKNCVRFNISPKKIFYQLTFNCVENIFRYKDLLNKKLIEVINFIISLSPKSISFDHKIPFCFWLTDTLSTMKKLHIDYYSGSCWGNDFGLIDADFNLLHCNQHPINIMNFFDNNDIVNFNILKNALIKANLEKRLYNLNKVCFNCKHFNDICTGGCFMHKDIIQIESIDSFVKGLVV